MVKGLSDLRTAIAARLHSKPPRKGTAHLDLYLLSTEKRRLEKELADLGQRQRRLQEHLEEIHQAIGRLRQEAEGEDLSLDLKAEGRNPAAASPDGQRQWKKITLDY